MRRETINLEPDEPILDARRLDQLITVWLDHCRKKLGRPGKGGEIVSSTVDGYADKIAYFRQWWAHEGPAKGWELKEADLHDFNRWLATDTQLGYNSRLDCLRRLRACLRWAYRYQYIPGIDCSLWTPKKPDGSAPLRVLAPLSVLSDVLRAATAARDKAILAILVDTGMRRAECAKLCIEDVRFHLDGSGSLAIRSAKSRKGKDVQGRVAIFSPLAGKLICDWLDELSEAGCRQGPLFPSPENDGRPLDPNTIYRITKRAIEAAGHAGAVQGPHDIRRIYVTENRRRQKEGVYDRDLRRQVGHSNALVTDIYDYGEIEDRRNRILSPFELLAAEGYSVE